MVKDISTVPTAVWSLLRSLGLAFGFVFLSSPGGAAMDRVWAGVSEECPCERPF
jgi:hypothetical protein